MVSPTVDLVLQKKKLCPKLYCMCVGVCVSAYVYVCEVYGFRYNDFTVIDTFVLQK